jgi:FixJ family two-component response regulator
MLHETTQDAIRVKLDELIASEPSERKSKLAEKLEPYREQITQAIAKGHTFRSIAGALRYGGMTISPETIRRYVQRINGNKAKRAARRAPATRAAALSTPAATVAATPTTIEQPPTPPLGRTLNRAQLRFDARI